MLKRYRDALALLAGQGAAGRSFFDVATLVLSTGLGCRRAAAVTRERDDDSVALLSLAGDGRSLETCRYSLRGTPCLQLYENACDPGYELLVESGLRARYPGDRMLSDLGAESYRGELFFDSAGKAARDVFPTERAAAFESHDEEVLRTLLVIERESWTPTAEGTRTLMVIKFPVFDVNGDLMAVGLIGTDITERKHAETELKTAKEEAAGATLAKSRFLASMSHELRTPLNAVIGITDMLREDVETEGPESIAEPLDRVSRAGKHLLHLINDVLDLSSNACKFTDSGEVRLHVSRERRADDTEIRFTVADTGVGIDSTQIAGVFNEFTQAGTTIGRWLGGSGLGLAISQSLCHLMGGRITVDSEPGNGSTFTVSLPAKA